MNTAHRPDSLRRPSLSSVLCPLSPRSRRRRRPGVVLLLVVSLLALFILLGTTFTVVALQALHGSKLELKQQQVGDQPETEMDLVLGQLLYDTQARTVLQFHSLLRDLYGYDGDLIIDPTVTATPQFRETFKGNVLLPTLSGPASTVSNQYFPQNVTVPLVSDGGGQLYSFLFALPPFSFACGSIQPTAALPIIQNNLTTLSTVPNYYAGRVITFTSGNAANRSARIVA